MILYLYLSNSRIYQLHCTDLLATSQLDLTLTSLSTLVLPSKHLDCQIFLKYKIATIILPPTTSFCLPRVYSCLSHNFSSFLFSMCCRLRSTTSIHLHCFALRCNSPCPQYLFPLLCEDASKMRLQDNFLGICCNCQLFSAQELSFNS